MENIFLGAYGCHFADAFFGNAMDGSGLWLAALIIMIVSLFGYAFKKQIAHNEFWRIAVLLSIAYYAVFTFWLDPQYGSLPPHSLVDYLVTILVPLPGFVAAVRHSVMW